MKLKEKEVCFFTGEKELQLFGFRKKKKAVQKKRGEKKKGRAPIQLALKKGFPAQTIGKGLNNNKKREKR